MPEARVIDNLLVAPEQADTAAVVVGSPAWFAWLGNATRFQLITAQGPVTVRKERSGGGRGGWYWRAYRKYRGRLHRVYLGPDTALTAQALAAAGSTLGGLDSSQSSGAIPRPTPVPDQAVSDSAPALILHTRLAPPALHPDLVARPALVARLRAAARLPLALLIAPAGFGKTTLLVQAFAGPDQPPRAWLSLEPGDDSPADFLAALHAALARVAPAAAGPTGALLRLPYSGEPARLLDQLLNDLALEAKPLRLVLDDYHTIASQAVHQLVARLIEHAPPSLHLIIASRSEPPLPLARLRARGHSAELRENDLRFRGAAAAELLRTASRVALSDADAAALAARSEGWAAGLQLAALALRDSAEPARVLAAFGGAHRLVADFLVSEVLADLAPELRRFLRETAILDRLCAPLCVALQSDNRQAAVGEAQARLEELERRGLFLTPLDATRTWYRYHPLFGELLRGELARSEAPAVVALLHRRAAAWYSAQIAVEGRPALEAAIGHALAGGAAAQAADLVEQAGLQAIFSGETATLQRWLSLLPPEEVRARPFLQLADAGHFPRLQHPQRVARELNLAGYARPGAATDQPREALARAEALAVRAYVSQACGDLELTATLLLDALALLPPSERGLHWRLLISLGNAYALEGWLEAAQVIFTTSLALADDPVLAYLSESYRAWIELSMGWLRQAQTTFARLRATAEAAGWAELPLMGEALLGLGATKAEQGQLGAALELLEHGLALLRRMGFNAMLLPGELERARVYRALGRLDEARAAVAAAEELARDFAVPFLAARVAAARIDLGLEQAERPLEGSALRYAELPVRLAMARAALRAGQAQLARALLAPLLEIGERRQWGWALLPARVLWALACAAEHDQPGALGALTVAARQAEAQGCVVVFLEAGPEAIALLRDIAGSGPPVSPGARAAARTLLAALATVSSQSAGPDGGVSLTPREREVLALLATGATNNEIAHRLSVTAGTVKAHCRSLYAKLGLANRTQAVAQARRLGLLDEGFAGA